MESATNDCGLTEALPAAEQPKEAAVADDKSNKWDVLHELMSDDGMPAALDEEKAPPAPPRGDKAPAGTATQKLVLFIKGIHCWNSLFVALMGTLIIAFGSVVALMISYNQMVSLTVAFVSIVTGTFFIGISKLIEAAEIYVIKNSAIFPAENKSLNDRDDERIGA